MENAEIKGNKVIIYLDKNIKDIKIKLHIKNCEACGTIIIANNKQKYCESCKKLCSQGKTASSKQQLCRKYYLRAYNRKGDKNILESFKKELSKLKKENFNYSTLKIKIKELYRKYYGGER